MTTRADLLRLANRVQREEPSAELDEAIAIAITPVPLRGFFPRPFTTSLDAAASLVPEGWHIVELVDAYDDSWVSCLLYKNDTGKGAQGKAPDEPRARTAAALRAMAQEIADEG